MNIINLIAISIKIVWDVKPWKHHILAKLRNFAQTSSQHYSSQKFSPKLNNKNILSTSTFHILCLWSISIFIRYNINEEVRICATFNHWAVRVCVRLCKFWRSKLLQAFFPLFYTLYFEDLSFMVTDYFLKY